MISFCKDIAKHYTYVWSNEAVEKRWNKGPVSELPPSFHVLEFGPTKARAFWTYATCCMSEPADISRLELHMFSPVQHDGHVELLTAIAHFHRTGNALSLGHTVHFGRPWFSGSNCDFGLISLPYLDGPSLEHLQTGKDERGVRFLWLLPITKAERDYKKKNGLEAFEQRLENVEIDYLNPIRESVV